MSGLDKPVVLYVDDEAGNLAAFNAAFRQTLTFASPKVRTKPWRRWIKSKLT